MSEYGNGTLLQAAREETGESWRLDLISVYNNSATAAKATWILIVLHRIPQDSIRFMKT